MFFEPVISRWINNKLITFYLPSYIMVFSLALNHFQNFIIDFIYQYSL